MFLPEWQFWKRFWEGAMSKIKTIPAFIDMHTHLREPGFEHKETLETGMAAGIRGGFGTLCAMPNTKPEIGRAHV